MSYTSIPDFESNLRYAALAGAVVTVAAVGWETTSGLTTMLEPTFLLLGFFGLAVFTSIVIDIVVDQPQAVAEVIRKSNWKVYSGIAVGILAVFSLVPGMIDSMTLPVFGGVVAVANTALVIVGWLTSEMV